MTNLKFKILDFLDCSQVLACNLRSSFKNIVVFLIKTKLDRRSMPLVPEMDFHINR